MALGGGNWNYTNKILPGTYTRTITVGRPEAPLTQGITAGALKLDWGPDGKVFSITAEQFRDRAEELTGYPYNAPENTLLREIFCHAIEFIGYRLNSNGKKAKVSNVGEAIYSGTNGNNITVSVLQNVNNSEKYDVSTYYNGTLKEIQTVPKAGIDEIALTKGTEKDGTAVETATATFDFNKNKITVTFSNVPEGYKPSVRIKGQVGILAFIPGRMEDMSLSNGNKHIITYSPGAPINGEMTVEAVLTKDKVTVLKSCTYTCQLNEDVEVGADASKLKDNTYVVFNKTGIIQENAGYVFSGGTTKDNSTIQDHVDALNALEPYFYNDMFCDSTDETVKQLYCENVERLCEEKGKYFQLVVYDYVEADSEKVISVKNAVLDTDENVNESSLVCWLAGYSSAIDLSLELTNKPYDGELNIFTDYPEVQLELLLTQGNFLFHNINLDEIRTLVDVNTLQTYTPTKDDQLANNKVVRIIFRIHNEEERVINSLDIGNLKNNPEGRTTLWNHCVEIFDELNTIGALRDYDPDNIEVIEIADNKYAVRIDQIVNVEGTIRQVYITTYVVE